MGQASPSLSSVSNQTLPNNYPLSSTLRGLLCSLSSGTGFPHLPPDWRGDRRSETSECSRLKSAPSLAPHRLCDQEQMTQPFQDFVTWGWWRLLTACAKNLAHAHLNVSPEKAGWSCSIKKKYTHTHTYKQYIHTYTYIHVCIYDYRSL